jgi:hypothetical protein
MWPTPLPAATSPFEVVLINPYELGRQPFGLAEPAALLKHAGFAVACLDRSLQKLDPDVLRNARLMAIHVGMHTAARIAVEALPHIQRLAPHAHLCVYGLYPPMNEALLRRLGAGTVLGWEVELALLSVGQRLRANGTAAAERGTEPARSALIPEGSYLLQLPGFREQLLPFDPKHPGYPWVHGDPRVDALQRDLQALVARSEAQRLPRREVFAAVWHLSHEAAQRPVPTLFADLGSAIPRLSEPWYCCAEPTDQQLQSF